ncbi:hypothetical protein GCM10028791_08860 [Echinicola sediminis]
MKEIKEIIKAYHQACSEGLPTVLATVVHIEGSSYRGPGARMLIRQDGYLTGAISGGCLEGDVLRKALMVMLKGKPLLLTYDTSEENDVFGVGLGCNGIIRVLLEPLPLEVENSPIALLEKVLSLRKPGVVVTYYSPEERGNPEQGTQLAFVEGQNEPVASGGNRSFKGLEKEVERTFVHRVSSFWKESQEGKQGCFFVEYVPPAIKLLVAGAGNDTLPLMEMANLLGWEMVLIDGRPAYAKHERFPGCQIVLGDAKLIADEVTIDEWTAVLLMSHNYEYDKAVLNEVIQSPSPYIGILGPRKKTDCLKDDLKNERGISSQELLSKIYGPIGLDIGAETSEEIALSIVSGVKAFFSQRRGGQLRESHEPIHQRETTIRSAHINTGILVLAAGSSKRMGAKKQVLEVNGVSLLKRAVKEALKVGADVTAVVLVEGAASSIKEQVEGLPLELVYNPDYKEGMASSVRAGIRHFIKNHPLISHVLIMVCDQVYLEAELLGKLFDKQAETQATIVASYYNGVKGVPALFHRSLFPSLMELNGDMGAKHLIRSHKDVSVVPFPEGGLDIDTQDDYQAVLDSRKKS